MKSMTGYGKGIYEDDNFKITIEIKTVNHKLFDLSLKLPRKIIFLEDDVRKIIKSKINRGHIDVFCVFEDKRKENALDVDYTLIENYINLSKTLCEKYNLYNDYSVSKIISNPEVYKNDDLDCYNEEIKQIVSTATDIALKNLLLMRENEGKNLEIVLTNSIESIQSIVNKMRAISPKVVEEYEQRLEQNMIKLLGNTEIDKTQLLGEVAIYADKVNIEEELNRLDSHLKSYYDYIKLNEPIGKKLDFLVQEINRELNTSGSKSNNYDLTKMVLDAKYELEKFREQVQNIE
ncbi:MAG: YicC family protein [Clostridia bacterium]|nr:YicC family protein [Clostridia bacterium]